VDPGAVRLTFMDPREVREHEALREATEGGDPDDVEIKTPFGVSIPVFEGPLDLVLYLIRRDKLDIYDIPIGHITEQYLGMLGVLRVLDLEVAGEFLVMAATLMRLKARMLLPTWPEGEEDDEDPRSELVRQLLEYRKFKEAAENLRLREADRLRMFGRGFVPAVEPSDLPPELEPVSQFALIEAIKVVLARVGEEFFYEVELEDVTLEEKVDLISRELEEQGRILFTDLMLRHPRRLHVVVAFMALLELARLGKLTMAQEKTFGQIWVYRAEGAPADAQRTEEAHALDAETAAPHPETESTGDDVGPDAWQAGEEDHGAA
jgi:segregation and condensation protein A